MRQLLAILLFMASPAQAGIKATYLRPDGGSTFVEVADNGDARIGPSDGAEYGLLVNGQFYMVETAKGRTMVLRIADIAAAAGLLLPAGLRQGLKAAKPSGTPTNLEADGSATIAGRRGQRFRMRGGDGTDRLVASDDPSLKPVGAAMEGIAVASVASMVRMFGKEPATEMLIHIRDMFSRGTPLQTFDGWVLTSVRRAEVGRDRVRLPGAPASLEQVRLHLQQGRPAKADR